MPLALPAELKKVTPYIRRAEELDRDKANPESRLVAYYCRQYAVHTGISLAQSPASKTALGTILNDLEKEKVAMSAFTREESKFLCTQFAEKIFQKADADDRAGLADKNTAKSFYAAASFMEILQQFYTDDDESEEREEERKRIVYSKWKATEILKAFKEGKRPTPGGYGEQSDDAPTDIFEEPLPPPTRPPSFTPSMPSSPPSTQTSGPVPIAPPDSFEEEGTEVPFDIGPPPAYPAPSAPSPVETREVFVPLPPPVPPPEREPPTKKTTSIFTAFGKSNGRASSVTKEMLADAKELTSFALAALDSKDDALAATRLEQALKALGR
jgi:vacuolar protein sorting-associated protein VTA1